MPKSGCPAGMKKTGKKCIPHTDGEVYHKHFLTFKDRNNFLKKYFPARKMSNVPGEYTFPPEGHLIVDINGIWWYTGELKADYGDDWMHPFQPKPDVDHRIQRHNPIF